MRRVVHFKLIIVQQTIQKLAVREKCGQVCGDNELSGK